MKDQVTFTIQIPSSTCYGDEDERDRILQAIPNKLIAIIDAPPALCDHPEDDNILRDHNGNRIGLIKADGLLEWTHGHPTTR